MNIAQHLAKRLSELEAKRLMYRLTGEAVVPADIPFHVVAGIFERGVKVC